MRRALSVHVAEVTATLAVSCLFLAVMSGHLQSIDGLVMWRQALSMTYHLSWSFVPPVWWGSVLTSSSRGVGASFQYVPALFVFRFLPQYNPNQGNVYDLGLLYADRLYLLVGAPVWVVVTAAAAFLSGLTAKELTGSRRAALWAIAFFSLGSPAFAASRGDTPQPLIALCWIAGLYASVLYRRSRKPVWLWIVAASLFYGVLVRPLEGSMLLIGALAILCLPAPLKSIRSAMAVGAAWVSAVLVTLATNWVRFGSPMNFGYRLGTPEASWTTPIWQGVPNALISPGRGVLWEFPALILAVVGARWLWSHERRVEVVALSTMPVVLFIESCTFTDWVGGWDWGFRFFQPALPLAAVLAGAGAIRLPRVWSPWAPALLLSAGLLWNVPAITTDILGGYGAAYQDGPANWRLESFPLIGAWRYLQHVFPEHGTDGNAVDIVWFRATLVAGKAALLPFVALLASGLILWVRSIRLVAGDERDGELVSS
ncbi:MAG TPA: hypothetical protein VFL29_14140 [Candidatus Dormibacteraeota bacterium]|nr:hypothetical protein [Candidatus Dormibacteraeota bacterium]